MGHHEPESNRDGAQSARDPKRSPYADLDVDAIMEKVRAELRSRGVLPTVDSNPSHEADRGLPRWQPVATRLADKPQYALGDFLGFDDEDFIDVVYRKLLRHPAGNGEAQGYLNALRHAYLSKVEVLGLIRFSPEGRKQGVHVDGLLLRYKLQRLQRVRVLGWFIRMGVAVARLPRLAWRLQGIEARAAREAQQLGRLVNDLESAATRHFADVDGTLDALYEEIDTLRREIGTLREYVADQGTMLANHGVTLGTYEATLGTHEATLGTHGATLGTHEAVLAKLQGRVQDDQRKLRAMLERLTVFLDTSVGHSVEPQSAEADAGNAPSFEGQYVSFEQAFRGDRQLIKNLASYCLDALAEAGIRPGDSGVVLDLGCGRGEWLEVLAEHGYRGRGVDTNREMLRDVEACGYEAVEADALAYLRTQEDNSLAAITSMHMVEHIPYPLVTQLIDEARRVLRPGGLLILETPNPENILVGVWKFYMDPTHRHPLPPLLLQWTVGSRGFPGAEIKRLTEYRDIPNLVPVSNDVPGASQLNQLIEWFTVATDYAIIARKPASLQ